ncbi:MAG TPA: hypothetical protein VLA99_03050 [Nitrospiraceae bacterium]|nr:hypothetical protein [Nitrospiraceae bacterium]
MLPSHLSFSESLHGETRQAFYDQHKAMAHVMHLGLFLVPLAGLLVKGLVGAVLGLTLFILCYYLLPYVWDVTHGSRHV